VLLRELRGGLSYLFCAEISVNPVYPVQKILIFAGVAQNEIMACSRPADIDIISEAKTPEASAGFCMLSLARQIRTGII